MVIFVIQCYSIELFSFIFVFFYCLCHHTHPYICIYIYIYIYILFLPSQDTGNSDTTSENSNADADLFFRHTLPRHPCFFFINSQSWRDLRKRQSQYQFRDLQWTNVIAKGIESVHPYCSIAFKRHHIKIKGSKRRGPLFHCLGYCTFADCPVCVEVTVTDESTLKAVITFQGGEVCHSLEELKRRPVRADERHNFAKQLESILPRALHLQNLEKIDSMVFESGCRDKAPTPAVLKNISWNSRKKARRHLNEILSLQKMVEERTDSEKILQKVLLHPRGVMLWSQSSIRLFHQRCKTDVVYIDATGSIIQKAKGKSSPFYIYELVVRHPIKGSSPVPVATYVTCDHTTSSVTYFLESFQNDYFRLFGKTSQRRPSMIMCDGSLVLLQAVAYSFCKVSLGQLLQIYYEVVTGKLRDEEFKIPIMHRCLSHVMKNAKVFCKKQ